MKKNGFYKYKTSPFDGKKMGVKWVGEKIVGIHKDRMDSALRDRVPLMVVNRDRRALEYMEFRGDEAPIEIGRFVDKWGTGKFYWLYYYVWNPKKQLKMNLGGFRYTGPTGSISPTEGGNNEIR